jgi:multisubunit Na+/H+ antiporter MnhB subunit
MLGGLVVLTALTAAAPALPWLAILAQRRGVAPGLALTAGLLQVVVLALNAISRQVVQNTELRRFVDVTAERLNIQWSPLVLFLLLFVGGLTVVAWMVTKAVEASRQPVAVRR